MKPLRILLAEDEESILQHVDEILRNAGYEVLPYAYSADDAIRKAERYRPDLVVMDINFSNDLQDGIYAADFIRRNLNLPVVYVTGAVDPETVERARLTSPYSYVLKPIEKDKILVSIELAIHNWKIDQRLREHERQVALAYIEGQDKQKIRLEDALHEGLGVRLSTMGFYLSLLREALENCQTDGGGKMMEKAEKHIAELTDLLNESTRTLKRISFDLVPNTLVNNGLEAGLRALEDRLLQDDPELDLSIEFDDNELRETNLSWHLSQQQELAAYWLAFDLVDYYVSVARVKEIVMQICLYWDSISMKIKEPKKATSWCVLQGVDSVIRHRNIEARLNLMQASIDIETEDKPDSNYRFIHIRLPVSEALQ